MTVFQLKVELLDIQPLIWRRVLVDATMRLSDLHKVLQTVLGWGDFQYYIFEKGGVWFKPEDAVDEWFEDDVFFDAEKVSLKHLFSHEGNKLLYVYDMEANWSSEIVVEEILEDKSCPVVPKCLGGERCSPPEDMGSIDAYEEMLRIIWDPGDARYRDLWDWLGEFYDPEHFDLNLVNDQLQDLDFPPG